MSSLAAPFPYFGGKRRAGPHCHTWAEAITHADRKARQA